MYTKNAVESISDPKNCLLIGQYLVQVLLFFLFFFFSVFFFQTFFFLQGQILTYAWTRYLLSILDILVSLCCLDFCRTRYSSVFWHKLAFFSPIQIKLGTLFVNTTALTENTLGCFSTFQIWGGSCHVRFFFWPTFIGMKNKTNIHK